MTPEASRRRTRSSDARGESPTVCASFWMVERPSRWSAARILTSMRSNAGGRLAAIDVCFLSLVSRAQRSTEWCAADPGPFRSVAVPDQRRTASLALALRRIRDTRYRRSFVIPVSRPPTTHTPSSRALLRERAFAAARAGWFDPCIFLFFCRFGSSIPGSYDLKQHALHRSRSAFLRPGFATLLHSPRIEGWAERRETFGCCAKHPLDTP